MHKGLNMHTKLSSGPRCPKFGLIFINIRSSMIFYAFTSAGPQNGVETRA